MQYPKPLNKGSTVGLTAPSSGVNSPLHRRLELSIANLKDLGFQVLEGRCLRSDYKHVSAPKKERAEELMRLWSDPRVDLIFPPWGGELLHEILPLLDFERMKATPTWIQGYSDISTLLLPITLITGIATSHGMNLMDSVPAQIDSLSRHPLAPLHTAPGTSFRQQSSTSWQKTWADFAATPEAPYRLSEPTAWKLLDQGMTSAHFKGRLLGGCLDTVTFLAGTRYGDVPAFARRYKDEKIVIYLENCDLSPSGVHRHLTHLRFAGWFEHVSGIMFGRSAGPDASSAEKLAYVEALSDVLGDFGVPIVYDSDIGHLVPQMTLINGALAEVHVADGRGWVEQRFV